MAVACLLTACGNHPQKAESDKLLHMNVEAAMENVGELKLSDLGKQVRYVLLETNDSCLIGNFPRIMVLDKQVLVYSNRNVYCFDKETGRFLNTIGHVGDDPKGYSSDKLPVYNERDGLLYFVRQPNLLQKYDLQGNYQGKVTVPTPPAMPDEYAFMDNIAVGSYGNLAQQKTHARALVFFNETGTLLDTLTSTLPKLPTQQFADLSSFNIYRGGMASCTISRFEDGTASVWVEGTHPLWKRDGNLRLKEIFNDTIYHVISPGSVAPYAVFATGKWHLPAEAYYKEVNSKDKLMPTFVLEGNNSIFFQCVRGLYEKNPETLNGVYNKRTGTTCLSTSRSGFTDDINGFRPFLPTTCGTQGEYAQMVQAVTVLNWLDKHPEAKENPALAPLFNLGEEDNPVVILVR